ALSNEWGFIHHTNLVGRTNRSGTILEAEEAEKAATNATETAEGEALDGAPDSAEKVADAGKTNAPVLTETNRTETARNEGRGQGNGRGQGSGRGQQQGRGQGNNRGTNNAAGAEE